MEQHSKTAKNQRQSEKSLKTVRKQNDTFYKGEEQFETTNPSYQKQWRPEDSGAISLKCYKNCNLEFYIL